MGVKGVAGGGAGVPARLPSARALLQLSQCSVLWFLIANFCPPPASLCRYAPTEEAGDAITALRNWHFSNRAEEKAPQRDEGASRGDEAAAGTTLKLLRASVCC